MLDPANAKAEAEALRAMFRSDKKSTGRNAAAAYSGLKKSLNPADIHAEAKVLREMFSDKNLDVQKNAVMAYDGIARGISDPAEARAGIVALRKFFGIEIERYLRTALNAYRPLVRYLDPADARAEAAELRKLFSIADKNLIYDVLCAYALLAPMLDAAEVARDVETVRRIWDPSWLTWKVGKEAEKLFFPRPK
jgi:hypothetical protein